MTRNYIISLAFLTLTFGANSQTDEDAFYIKKIYETTLKHAQCYEWLSYLSEDIGGRLAGSAQAQSAAYYTRDIMEEIGFDSVWLQPCTVKHWERGNTEIVRITESRYTGAMNLRCTSLGNSIGTGPDGVSGEILEVFSLAEVDSLGALGKVEGKIVFYNRPFDVTQINTFNAYSGAVDQRGTGPRTAAKYGAKAALVRSMTTRLDDIPHTGATRYRADDLDIPAMAISTNDAELLSKAVSMGAVQVYMENHCGYKGDKTAYNVIGEIRGSMFPEEIILVGGHLDSWDIGGGAHDDGAGCVHSMQVIQTMNRMGYKPKRTIRCVLFMNEENGGSGANTYARISAEKGEFHMAAIESDAGGFTPRGFRCEADKEVFVSKYQQVTRWSNLLEPYGLGFSTGGSGADVTKLKPQKGLLIGFRPDTQRYFDFHHTEIDRIDAVNKRELELGAASISALVYLLDKYGLK